MLALEHQRQHHHKPCKDASGTPLITNACQPQPVCPVGRTCSDFVTGNVVGYTTLPKSAENEDQEDEDERLRGGLVVMLTGGTEGCDGAERSTNITLVCSPGRGTGAPAAPANRTVEGPACHNELVWESEYACPLCTAADDAFVYGECRNNSRSRSFYWLHNPRRCHGGVELPPDDTVPANCTSRTLCDPGHDVDTATGACVACAPGTWSLGAGERLARFSGPQLPPQLATDGAECPGFAVHQQQLRAAVPTAAGARHTTRFVTNGTIAIDDALLLADPAAATLTMALDDELVTTDTAAGYHRTTQLVDAPEGAHTLTITLAAHTAATAATAGGAATESVVRIEAISTSGNSYAPTSCSACGAGEYQDAAGGSECKRCPLGIISAPGFAACQACPPAPRTPTTPRCLC